MRSEIGLVVLLASCGDKPAPAPAPIVSSGSAARTTVAPDAREIDAGVAPDEALGEARELAAAVASLPQLYAPLFAGTSPQFPGETMFEFPLEIRENAGVETGNARCYIRPAVIPGGVLGSMICAPFGMGGQVLLFTLDTDLVATRAGLWFETEAIDDASKLDPKRMVLAANPKPKRTVLSDPQTRSRTTLTATQHGETWCITAVRKNRAYLCLRAGVGIVGGGGSGPGMGSGTRLERWGVVPAAPSSRR